MSDSDLFREMKRERRRQGMLRRKDAGFDFPRAAALARRNGLRLICHNETHYQLRGGEWLINLYPGNQRILADRQKDRAPYLDLPDPWTLVDAVEAAAEKCNADD